MNLRDLSGLALTPFLFAALGCHASSHGTQTVETTFSDLQVIALVNAAEAGDTARVAVLAGKGANVNFAGREGITPLVWVMSDANRTVVEKLLEIGADPNQKIDSGTSPTWLAAGRADPQMLELMLQHHGDPNIKGSHDDTALEIAVRESLMSNIDLLVSYGADIKYASAPGETGNSAATWAAALGRFNILEHLLNLGYSTDLQHLAAMVQARHVPPDSEQQRSKDRVIGLLKARGVRYPVSSAQPK